MIGSVGRTRQLIEVLAQDFARQEYRADAKASLVNFGRDEVLISFVLPGLADVSDWRLVERAIYSRRAVLRDEDFRTRCIWCWNWVISSPMATDFARKGDKRSLV